MLHRLAVSSAIVVGLNLILMSRLMALCVSQSVCLKEVTLLVQGWVDWHFNSSLGPD